MNKYSKRLQLLLLLQLPALGKNKVCARVRMRVRVRGRGRNTVWALLGSGVFSNKEHILQTARELFLLRSFTSPQAENFFVGMFLRLIVYSMQGLNLQVLIWQNSCSLRGMPCLVHPVEGREGRVMGTSWLWGAAEAPADFSENRASVSDGGFYRSVELWG